MNAKKIAESPVSSARPKYLPAESLTREQRRSRRKRPIRGRTINVQRLAKWELETWRRMFPEAEYWRPRSRAECIQGPRPCPYVACKYHLYADVSSRSGAIKLNFPDLSVSDLVESCALDVADRGGATLEEVGEIMNLTRERIRQLEVRAMAKLHAARDMLELRECPEAPSRGKRQLPDLRQKR